MKLMFSVDITPVVRSRDGSLSKFISGERFDFRISFHGCSYGENVVIRILNSKNQISLTSLGYSDKVLKDIKSMIHSHGGLVIFIGPTGSGKTTSLYASISELDHEKLNIMTAEDPIEKKITGVQQVDINSHPELNFANCLRSILRQDPDVILIGEIRDSETAQMALRAAMTGHKVFTTMHARSTIDVVDRLEELGIPRRLAINNIRGIVAQRLIKKNCQQCKGAGCDHCDDIGSYDRCVVAESLLFTAEVIKVLSSNSTNSEKVSNLLRIGYKTMMDDGLDKLKLGIISNSELVNNVDHFDNINVNDSL
jgi:type II secretory ATPase GspE/PulE/Tfp pilus assembly ATPase PilB-like protein